MKNEIRKFASKEGAKAWMYDEVDDPCTDNERFAFLDDDEAVRAYKESQSTGCCAFSTP